MSVALGLASLAASAEESVKPASTLAASQSSALASVAPALAGYSRKTLNGELWQRPGLSPRDRSLVTVAALIARDQRSALSAEIERALDNGVTPAEIAELITHLAFYSGWPNALSAVEASQQLFTQRDITVEQLPAATVPLLPLDEEAESKRRQFVDEQFGKTSPGVVQYTTDLLFRDLWLRPALAPRDRSLVTVSALIAAGQVEQMPFHLNKAMDNGLTEQQAGEVLTQLAFYAGWPRVFSALPVAKLVFAQRSAG
ncbi:4-carboxymuconolactone decarboxylase [Pokkaliibacter plantistimulans]|uniref:4-carboxymuconolactone decarboxylase n=2 Tax=Pseudomonadota TaxID=1224 RepID=A0A2S5KP84_9PROT|nr:4-carboxymuconolactone decarboxylase [Pokkaliibacter plantistimulans]